MNQSVIKPLLTEKASRLVAQNVYTFVVGEEVNKHMIAEILEKTYKVKVAEVKMAKKAGKTRRVGKLGRTKQLPAVKVAYVKLKEGKIDLFPQA
jgi:large subunit ribosomal protein L23